MADNSVITEVVSKEADKEIKALIENLGIATSRVADFKKAASKIKFPSEGKKFIKETNDELARSNKITSDAEAAQKRLSSALTNYAIASSKTGKAIQQVRNETNQLNKENRASFSAFDKLKLSLEKAEKKYKDLAARLGTGAKETEKAKRQVDRLRKSIDSINQPIKRFGDNVGNYPSALKGATTALKSFISAFGLTSGIFLFVQVLRDGFKSVREFGKSMANLSGILQQPRESLKDLEDVIISVAGKSVNTATQVAKLAEALVTLGKTKEEIKVLLEPVNNLAIGLETTAENAGELLVKTLNSFQESSDQGQRFADIIAKIRTSTALDFEKIKDSLAFLAPTAKAAGVSFEQSGALLGTLVDNGIKAERAGRLLSSSFLRLAGNGQTLEQGLDQLGTSYDTNLTKTERLALASEVFGKNAGPLALILADNREKVDELTESFENAGGTLDGLINEQLKSLDASLLILQSRWEEYILRSDQAGGSSQKLSKLINFLSDNLDKILDTIIDAGQAFITYKAIMLGVALVTRAYSVVTVGLRIAKIALSGGIGKATAAMKAFNVATKSNPIGLLISVVAGGVATWLAFRDGVQESAKALREAREEADKTRNAIVAANVALVKEQLNRISKEITNEKKATAEKIKLVKEEIEGRKNGSKLISEVEKERAKEEEETSKRLAEARKQFEKGVTREEENRIQRIKSRAKEEINERKNITKQIEESTVSVNKALKTDVIVGDLAGTKETIKELENILNDLQKTQKEVSKSNQEIDKNSAKDRFALEKQRLQFQIKASEEILNNENETIENRLKANNDFVVNSNKLSLLERDFAISNAKDRKDELIRIAENFENESTEITNKGISQRDGIFESNFQKQLERADKLSQEFERRLEKEVIALENQLLEKGATTEQIEKRVQEFINDQREQALNKQLDLLKTELLAIATTAEQKAEIEERINKLKARIVDVDIKRTLTAEEKKQIAIQKTQDLLRSFGDIFQGITDRKIQEIDKEIEANNRRYDIILENENLTEDQRKQIERKREVDEERLNRKRIEEERKAAIFQKTLAIAQIAINTSLAISKSLATNPLPKGAAFLALNIALGAAQTAAVIAQPIPQYADGKKPTDSYTGKAIAGEAPGKTEYHLDKHGNLIGVYDTATLIDTKAGDTILKDTPSFQRYALDNSLIDSVLLNNTYLPQMIKLSDISKKSMDYDLLYHQVSKGVQNGLKNFKNINKIYISSDTWGSNSVNSEYKG